MKTRTAIVAILVVVALAAGADGQADDKGEELATLSGKLGPEGWIQLISLYGPSAILLLFVIVTERKIFKRMQVVEHKRWAITLYCANWGVIVGLVVFTLYVWVKEHLPPDEYTIRGRITNLKPPERIEGKGDSALFLSHRYTSGGQFFDYLWRLPTPKRLPANESVHFVYFKSASLEDIEVRVITIEPWFYDGYAVIIEYSRDQGKFYLLRGEGKRKEFVELPRYSPPITMTPEPTNVGFALVSTAEAQNVAKLDEKRFRIELESSEPWERYAAREKLAKYGDAALPFIRDVLVYPKSSYRLRVGVMVALNGMESVSLDLLGAPAIVAILTDAASHDEKKIDPTLGEQARIFVRSYEAELVAYIKQVIESTDVPTDLTAAQRALELLGGDKNQRTEYERRPGLRIPDNASRGVSDELTVPIFGDLRTLRVTVHIEHTYIGDLRVDLITPRGDTVTLHNRFGGGTDNLSQSYSSNELPGLKALVGQAIEGNWRLHVADLARRDIGILTNWHLELDYVPFEGTRAKTRANLKIPDNDPTGVESTVYIEQSDAPEEIEVSINIRHTWSSDLRVELFNPLGTGVILHGPTRDANDLNRKYNSENTPELASLLEEPITGKWRLRVTDLSANNVGVLNDWGLSFKSLR